MSSIVIFAIRSRKSHNQRLHNSKCHRKKMYAYTIDRKKKTEL